ncbi:NUDIX hydrolase [Hyphococcus flavus]|uniref:NUDIX hydrolase n=1 Tax=Hyphococcus flavus TaxID=1866326 RepID=A0AAF0CG56_9PROT|nr:NUDIX hydrolase [Hyphococcus flavus]WDI31813.1 NUDIX hydrolase [Hyphococcus flavus]
MHHYENESQLPFDCLEDTIMNQTKENMPEVALAIVHRQSDNRYLLLRRSGSKDFKGWVFPGGKIECDTKGKKETPCRAARRELKEETGLVVIRGGRSLCIRQHPVTNAVLTYVYFNDRSVSKRSTACVQEKTKSDDVFWASLEEMEDRFHGGVWAALKRELRALQNGDMKTSHAAPAKSLFEEASTS